MVHCAQLEHSLDRTERMIVDGAGHFIRRWPAASELQK
jgi:hypothetical protein